MIECSPLTIKLSGCWELVPSAQCHMCALDELLTRDYGLITLAKIEDCDNKKISKKRRKDDDAERKDIQQSGRMTRVGVTHSLKCV